MNSKIEEPTLQGEPTVAKKRDEKEEHDPNSFQDIILEDLNGIIAHQSGQINSAKDSQTVIDSFGNKQIEKVTEDTSSDDELVDSDIRTITDAATALIEIPFETRRLAEIAFNSLSVDKGPRGDNKELTVKDNKLVVKFRSVDSKSLRKSLNSFLDFTNLVIKTIERFDTV